MDAHARRLLCCLPDALDRVVREIGQETIRSGMFAILVSGMALCAAPQALALHTLSRPPWGNALADAIALFQQLTKFWRI